MKEEPGQGRALKAPGSPSQEPWVKMAGTGEEWSLRGTKGVGLCTLAGAGVFE